MIELKEIDLKNITGGGFNFGLGLIIGGIVTFAIGIIDGIVRPFKCN